MEYNELYHHGVLGMHWGVHRSLSSSARVTRTVKPKEDTKPTVKSTEKSAEKKVNEMSDEELRSRVNRLQLEQQYKTFSKKEATRGKKVVDFLLKNVVNDVVLPSIKEAGKEYLTKKLKEAVEASAKKKS